MNTDLKNLSLTLFQTKILDDISVKFLKGSITAVLGANGSGKSSLLKCIVGLTKFGGSVVFSEDYKNKIAYIPQRPAVPIGMTVAEFILLGRTGHYNWYRGETSRDLEKCKEAIINLSLSEYSNRQVDTLSGGEMQRAILARAIAQEASLLVLDEPTSALDIPGQIEVFSNLIRLQKKFGLTVIIALHDLNAAMNFTDNILFLKKGRLLLHGETATTMTSKNLSEVYSSPIEVSSNSDGVKVIMANYQI